MFYFDLIHITQLHVSSNKKAINKIEIIQNKKLVNLIGEQHTPNVDKVIFNFSNYVLNNNENSLLIKGLNLLYHLNNLISVIIYITIWVIIWRC